jgi:hypothetical protein
VIAIGDFWFGEDREEPLVPTVGVLQTGWADRGTRGQERDGARSRTRTADPLLTMEVLCRLS